MLQYLKKEANITYTENGAVTNKTSFSDCVDLFGTIGALRRANEDEIIRRFLKAYTEAPDTAMKILFYSRDIRGGLGERRVFRTIIKWLAENERNSLVKNLNLVAEYGRWDDLVVLLDTSCRKEAISVIREQLNTDIANMNAGAEVSLLAKWLPSVNASNAETVRHAKLLARELGMKDAQYRKKLTALRAYIRIIENNLREKDYTFDYSKQPSKAMYKYRKAFFANDAERYKAFLDAVNKGEVSLHADTLMPYELVEPYLAEFNFRGRGSSFMRAISEEEKAVLNATWGSLPKYENSENALAIIDTSGSMYMNSNPMPAAVALSLGLYFAEHSTGAFANHFIEFSAHPQLIEIKGETFADRLRYVCSFNEVANTNIEAVFELILQTAINNKLSQSDLPAKLYLISDMEFDYCVRGATKTNFELFKSRFEENGYKLPEIIFWNVESRNSQQPVTVNDRGVALVSGCSPRVFSMVMEGELSPYDYMMSVIGGERYAAIAA